jgi:hypothetical protein
MKLANRGGRAVLVLDGATTDVEEESGGRFGPDPMHAYEDWRAFADFAAGVTTGAAPLVEGELRCPVPAPRQVFAIGLNYRSHAEESGMAVPSVPATFTKFPARWRARSTTSSSSAARSTGRSSWSLSSAPGPTGSTRPTPGRTSPASPSARTSATARCSSRPARSSPSGSRAAASGPWGRGSPPSTR